MGVTILVCSCGRRLRVAGMAPGKTGRCPACRGLIRVPDAPVPPLEEDEWNWQGEYGLGEVAPALGDRPAGTMNPCPDDPEAEGTPSRASSPAAASEDDEWNWQGSGYELDQVASAPPPPETPSPEGIARHAARLIPPTPAPAPRPGPWWPPDFLYPLRAAEGIAMAAALGTVAWVMGTLVPEYCLALIADGEKLGTPTMGQLVSLITALPVLLMIPPVAIYWLQYLARVLVASAEGEARPPRPPDRNFDGLLDGLGRWLIWAVLGAGVALLPLAAYGSAASAGASWNPRIAAGLGLLGLPYALMALLMAFLHDDALAANPVAVLFALGRLGPSFLGLSLTIAATLGLAGGAFAAAFSLRNQHFSLYVTACLACWLLTVWSSIVAMRTMGAYYHPRRARLGWRRERPRWGASR